jgi:hypothetical protein
MITKSLYNSLIWCICDRYAASIFSVMWQVSGSKLIISIVTRKQRRKSNSTTAQHKTDFRPSREMQSAYYTLDSRFPIPNSIFQHRPLCHSRQFCRGPALTSFEVQIGTLPHQCAGNVLIARLDRAMQRRAWTAYSRRDLVSFGITLILQFVERGAGVEEQV